MIGLEEQHLNNLFEVTPEMLTGCGQCVQQEEKQHLDKIHSDVRQRNLVDEQEEPLHVLQGYTNALQQHLCHSISGDEQGTHVQEAALI